MIDNGSTTPEATKTMQHRLPALQRSFRLSPASLAESTHMQTPQCSGSPTPPRKSEDASTQHHERITSASRCRLVSLKEITILVVEGVVEREDLYEEMLFDKRCTVCEAWREQFGAKCVDEVVQRGDEDETVELMLSWKMEDRGKLEREMRIYFQYVGGQSKIGTEEQWQYLRDICLSCQLASARNSLYTR